MQSKTHFAKLLIGLIIVLVIPLVLAENAVQITPANPHTNDSLFCSVNGTTAGYFFKWYVNEQYSGIEIPLLDSSETQHYQIWKCIPFVYYPITGYIPIGENYATIQNTAPELDFLENITADENKTITINPTASDIDNDNLTFNYTSPVNTSGQWQTNYNSAGTYTTTITVSDGNLTDSQDITITINNVNRKPNITSVIAPNSSENETLNFSFTAEDKDADDVLSYEIKRNSTIVSDTNSYQWTPDFDSSGTYEFEFIVKDDKGGNDSETRTITINNVNRAPEINSITAPPSINEGQILSVSFTASDADNDNLTYQILKNGTEITTSNSYQWQTSYNDSGVYNFTFIVSDGTDSESDSRIITINDSNRAPIIDSYYPTEYVIIIAEPNNQSFNISASDPDSDPLTITWYNNNNSEATGNYSYDFIGNYSSAGEYNIKAIITDGYSNVTQEWFLLVTKTNHPPIITNVTITPELAYTNDTLTCNGDYFDYENNTESGSTYRWFNNSVEISGANSKTLASSLFVKNDLITCEYTPSDGTAGAPVNSSPITILNTPPYFGTMQNQTIAENSTLTYTIPCNDIDNDNLTYSDNSTLWNISTTTGLINWTPDYNDSGYYTYTITCNEGNASINTTFAINVTNTNRPPTANIISPVNSSTHQQGNSILFNGTGSDPDKGALAGNSLIWTSSLDGNFGNGTSFNYDNLSNGTHTITLTAIDNESAQDTDSITITITQFIAKTGNVVINEFMANPNSGPDWIEIYNNDSFPINISGWYLKDNANHSTSTENIILNQGQYSVINCSWLNDTTQDTIYLYNSTSNLIDNFTYSSPLEDISIGRYPDGTTNWINLSVSTPGTPNAYGTLIINSTINQKEYNESPIYYENYHDNITGINLYVINNSIISGNIINVNISYIYDSNITNSPIINSTATNCTVIDSILKDTTCKDTYIDPSNTTGSTVIESSIIDSNATYSNITNGRIGASDINNSNIYNESEIALSNVYDSTISNSRIEESNVTDSNFMNVQADNTNIDNSNIISSDPDIASYIKYSNISKSDLTDVDITDSEIINSTINNTELSDITAVNAVINGTELISGIIIFDNNTVNASNGTVNLLDHVNFPPDSADIWVDKDSAKVGETITFKINGTDPNIHGLLNDRLRYQLDFKFGDTEPFYNKTGETITVTHSYSSAGTYHPQLWIIDKYNKNYNLIYGKGITITSSSGSSGSSQTGSSGGSSGSITYSITLTEQGITKQLRKNDKLKFTYDNKTHYATLKNLSSTKATVLVESTPIETALDINETEEFDLNSNNLNDFSLTLEGISNNKANLTAKLIPEQEKASEHSKQENKTEKTAENNTTKKERTTAEEWQDYVKAEEEDEEITSNTKILSVLTKSFSYIKNTISKIPYLKYIIAGIVILIIIILTIIFAGKNKKQRWKKIGKIFNSFFFED